MFSRPLISTNNRLLDALPPDEKKKLLAKSEAVDLTFSDVLCEQNQNPRHIYFPVTGIISLVVGVGDEAAFELTMIGNEGMLGATKVLGVSEAPLRGIVQAEGKAIRIAADAFEELSEDGSQLQAIIKRYLYVLMTQLNRTAGCTHFHAVNSRLARWLLMAHDRTAGDRFYLTQQFLSEMLGVQRSAVSIAASLLQNKELISYSRGEINILDRRGLEAESCSCYGALIKDQHQFYLV